MRRLFRTICAVGLLLLFGCAPQPAKQTQYQPLGELPPDEIAARRSFSFLVDSGGDPILRQAAELFADKLTELTGGGLAVEVSSSVNVAGDFKAGRAQIVFLDSRKAEDPHGDFALLSGAMRYLDYETFTMSLNSSRLLETLNDRLADSDTMLLAAFYQGSNQLIADRAPVRGNLLGDPIAADSEGEFREEAEQVERNDLTVAVRSGSIAGPLLEEYGMLVSEAQGLDARVSMLVEGKANVAEFSTAELESVMLPAGMHYLITRHSASPLWFAVEPSSFTGLPPVYQAAVIEACSYLFPLIDEHYLDRDARIAERLRLQGVSVHDRLDGLRSTAYKLAEEEVQADSTKKYMLNILSGLT